MQLGNKAYSGLLGQNQASELVKLGVQRRVLLELLVDVLRVDIVSDSYKLLVHV